jgi:hypothetical protein
MTFVLTRRRGLAVLASLPALALIGRSVGAAAGQDILSVRGPNAGTETLFSDEQLSALPQISFTTSTLWTEGDIEFSGPALHSVLNAANLSSGTEAIRLTALNDYSVTMERSLIEPMTPIVANRMNGSPFSVRDKGPLWVMFPFDQDIRFRSESYFALSIWQLSRIETV